MTRLDADIVMQDLELVSSRLLAERSSPAEVRRLLQQFATLSQKLTATMRKDVSRVGNRKFAPTEFHGWTPVTAFFKELRNVDLHDLPLTVEVRHTKSFPFEHNDPRLPPLRLQLIYSQVPDQGGDKVPHTVSMEAVETDGSTSTVPIVEQEYFFAVESRNPKIAKLLAALPTEDVHVLTQDAIATLREYYRWFQNAVTGRT